MTLLNDTLLIAPVELHTTEQLTPVGKDYLCFQINGRYSHADWCVKSRITNKAIDYILSIDKFEQQCIVIKGMLQSPPFEYHMKTIGIDLSLSNRYSFENNGLNEIKIYINMKVSVMTNKT